MEGVHGCIDEALQVLGGRVARHHDVAIAVHRGLNQHVGDGEARALEARRKADLGDGGELVRVHAQLLQIQVHEAVGADQADGHQRRRDHLGDDGCQRHARHAHVEADDEQQVQQHVHQARERQEVQRTAGVAHRAQHRRAEVVQHVEGHADKIDADVLRCQRQHALRRAHPFEEGPAKDEAEDADGHAADQADKDGGVHRLLGAPVVTSAVVARRHHVRAHRQPQKHVDDEVDQRRRGAHRRQGLLARAAPHHDHVRRVVQKLQYARQHQRNRKRRHLWNQLPVGHVQLIAAVCSVQHFFTPKSCSFIIVNQVGICAQIILFPCKLFQLFPPSGAPNPHLRRFSLRPNDIYTNFIKTTSYYAFNLPC